MTVMRWVRLDTAFPQNSKVLELVGADQFRAIAAYICGLSHAGAQGTEGWIPRAAIPMIHGTIEDAQQLVEVGLWIPGRGGWMINDWLDYQPSNDTLHARTERARAAAYVRWHDLIPTNGSESDTPG